MNQENRRIIAGLAQRIPELLPAPEHGMPPEDTGSSETGEEQQGRGVWTRSDAPGAQDGAGPRAWSRRVFRG